MPSIHRGLAPVVAAVALSVISFALSSAGAQTQANAWISTWTASPQSPRGVMPTSFSNQTVRQIVRVSIGGNKVRIRLSNEFGRQASPDWSRQRRPGRRRLGYRLRKPASAHIRRFEVDHPPAGRSGLERSGRAERRSAVRRRSEFIFACCYGPGHGSSGCLSDRLCVRGGRFHGCSAFPTVDKFAKPLLPGRCHG